MKRLPEQKLWDHLNLTMKPFWRATRHEDREITPGVPDLHYSMGPKKTHRIGWLELKASDKDLMKSNKIGVEVSQRYYIRDWMDYMDIHFLIRVKTTLFLIDGKYYGVIPSADQTSLLCSLSDGRFWEQKDTAATLPALLDRITRI